MEQKCKLLFEVEDTYTACVTNAKPQASWVRYLLQDVTDAKKLSYSGDAAVYNDEGSITVKYK